MGDAFDPRHIKAARTTHHCHGCLAEISIGSPYVRQAGMNGGDFWSIAWCEACWAWLTEHHAFWDANPDGCMPGDVGECRRAAEKGEG